MIDEIKYTDKECERCGRTDLEVGSNGLCSRCDCVLYGKRK